MLHPVEMVKLDDGNDELQIGEVDVFVGPNYVLSVRHRTHSVRRRAGALPSASRELLRHGAGLRALRADR